MPKRLKDLMEESLTDRLPIDVLPVSNEEFIPPEPTREQHAIMKIAREDCEATARKLGMSRRKFLQTGAAYAICLAAINKVMGTRGGYYAWAQDSCGLHAPIGTRGEPTYFDLAYPGSQLNNLPGEFIMDLQTHHVVPSAQWYTENTGEAAFFLVAWSQANCGELDRNECLSRFHYLKELMLDSATDVTILSAVPWKPDGQPLPLSESINTAEIVRTLAGGTRRTYCHKFVMPNRGSLGDNSDSLLTGAGLDPVYFQEEMDLMTAAAAQYGQNDGYLRAWKIYTPWGDVPNTSGWWLDDSFGLKFIQHVKDLADTYGMPPLICAHKGFALPSFDQEKAATRDVGVVAPMFWDLRSNTGVIFIIYHSGYDGDSVGLGGPFNQGTSSKGPYPGETAAPSTSRGVDNFITALRENGCSARQRAQRLRRARLGVGLGRRQSHARELASQQAHLLGRAEAGGVGHRRPVGRIAAGADRSAARLPDVGRSQGHLQPAVGPRRRRRPADPPRQQTVEEHPQRHPRAERRRAVPDRSGPDPGRDQLRRRPDDT